MILRLCVLCNLCFAFDLCFVFCVSYVLCLVGQHWLQNSMSSALSSNPTEWNKEVEQKTKKVAFKNIKNVPHHLSKVALI